jgi:hypothetical protein
MLADAWAYPITNDGLRELSAADQGGALLANKQATLAQFCHWRDS